MSFQKGFKKKVDPPKKTEKPPRGTESTKGEEPFSSSQDNGQEAGFVGGNAS